MPAGDVERLREALSWYQDRFCEGFCAKCSKGYINAFMKIDCGGCRARAVLDGQLVAPPIPTIERTSGSDNAVPAQLVCHDEQLTVWEGKVLDEFHGFLRGPEDYEDGLAMRRAARAAIQHVVSAAFSHPLAGAIPAEAIRAEIAWHEAQEREEREYERSAISRGDTAYAQQCIEIADTHATAAARLTALLSEKEERI